MFLNIPSVQFNDALKTFLFNIGVGLVTKKNKTRLAYDLITSRTYISEALIPVGNAVPSLKLVCQLAQECTRNREMLVLVILC